MRAFVAALHCEQKFKERERERERERELLEGSRGLDVRVSTC